MSRTVMRLSSVAAISWMWISPLQGQSLLRSVLLLDSGWEFCPMDDFQAWPAEPELSADQIKQLRVPGPGAGWRAAHIPDDYVVRGGISEEPGRSLLAQGAVCAVGGSECEAPSGSAEQGHPGTLNRAGRSAYGGHGYLRLYPAWYRRKLVIPASSKGKSVWLDFGGIYRDAVIFVNGQFIDQHASGYSSFRLNITSAVHYREENTVAVFVDPRWFEGWWYEGGGIYRHVRLVITDPLQIAPWGVFVRGEVSGEIRHGSPAGDRAAAALTMETTVRNDETADRSFTLVSQVLDRAGKVIASTSSPQQLASGSEATFTQNLALPEALLWSLEHPNLYKLRTTVSAERKNVDQTLTAFGIRTLRFDPEQGFFLNGQHVEIHGAASHQGFPGVGIAASDNLWSWRILKLKAMGANAYRTAHNPVGEEFYEAADRLGVLVMDENRHLGDTYAPKATGTTPYSDLSDLKAMVLQHRNHPSIIMWSLCNEEGQGKTPYGAKMFAAMKEAVKKIDPTRPTTSAMNGGFTKDGFASVEDLLGMNYRNAEFAKVHSEFTSLMIFGSEDNRR